MKPSKAVKQARRTAWNSTLPAPSKPMKRSTIERRTRLKARGKSKRFAALRDPVWAAYIRSLPCVVGRDCWGRVECAHVRSRGAGGVDRGNTVSLCAHHHDLQHDMGIRSFQKHYGVNLAKIAEGLATEYQGAGFR